MTHPIRLAFCGASGTGKSTLAMSLSERLHLPICPVGSREVSKEMGFASPYDVDAAGQRIEFQHRLLRLKGAWELDSKASGFITDRTHLDNVTYTTMHAAEGLVGPFMESMMQLMELYTHIVFCPMSAVHKVGDDPQRIADDEYHERYETILTRLLHEYASPTPILWLTSGDRDMRVRQVLKFVSP